MKIVTTFDDHAQEEIEEKLQSMDHVKALIHDIRANGGLIDPVIVKDGTLEVLEGNSRLAAYRWLYNKDPIRWGRIKCTLLPRDIRDQDVFALLGQYHIKGKQDWAPYEQAGFLYRRHKDQSEKISDLAQDLGISQRRVSQLIEAYELMIQHNDTDIRRWSYYEEFVKSNLIRKVRKKIPEFDESFAEKVKSGEISKAADVREKLPKIVCKEKLVAKFVNGDVTLDEAYDRVDDSGNLDGTYRKLSSFRSWLASEEAQTAIIDAPPHVRKKLSFEVSKLAVALGRLDKKLGGQDHS